MVAIPPAVIVARMRLEAMTWMHAVNLQHARIDRTFRERDSAADMGDVLAVLEVDVHLLILALGRLRRAVVGAATVAEVRQRLGGALERFDGELPDLRIMRNVGEHIDEYIRGAGRDSSIDRFATQGWSMGANLDGFLVWRWLTGELDTAQALAAALTLYDDALATIAEYVGEHRHPLPPEQRNRAYRSR